LYYKVYGIMAAENPAFVEKRRRARILLVIALVLGLHLTIVWMLLATSRRFTRRMEPQSLEMVYIPRPPAARENNAAGQVLNNTDQWRRAAPKPSLTPPTAPQEGESNAIHPPIDWGSELERSARNSTAEGSSQKKRDFGFPHTPQAGGDKGPEFGWDYAATHRIESLPEGGLLIHLNDNCVLILFPLPFGGCAIGTRKANGDLFKNMNDPPPASPSIVP
jgi:hypothetical protein